MNSEPCGLPGLLIRQVKVVFPVRAVARSLPAARDGLAVVAECAREALREARRFPPHLPDAIEEAHLVHTGDTTRVVIEYAIRLARRANIAAHSPCIAADGSPSG